MTTATERERGRASARDRHDSSVNLRMPTQTKDLITTAAAVLGKTRTEFIIESAHSKAVDVLLDQRLFLLDSTRYQSFVDVLDNPPAPGPKLTELMRRRPLWEK